MVDILVTLAYLIKDQEQLNVSKITLFFLADGQK